jgi:hypothetical protein
VHCDIKSAENRWRVDFGKQAQHSGARDPAEPPHTAGDEKHAIGPKAYAGFVHATVPKAMSTLLQWRASVPLTHGDESRLRSCSFLP